MLLEDTFKRDISDSEEFKKSEFRGCKNIKEVEEYIEKKLGKSLRGYLRDIKNILLKQGYKNIPNQELEIIYYLDIDNNKEYLSGLGFEKKELEFLKNILEVFGKKITFKQNKLIIKKNDVSCEELENIIIRNKDVVRKIFKNNPRLNDEICCKKKD